MRGFIASLVFVTAAGAAPVTFAQSQPRTAVSATIGVGANSSATGVVVGGAVLFDTHEWVSIEGQGLYVGRGRAADAFTAAGSLLFNLLPAGEPLVPYATVGGAVYHVSFDLANPRFLGPLGMQFGPGTTVCPAPGSGFGFGPGPGFGAGMGACPATAAGYWGVGALPDFYARRLGALTVPAGGWGTRTFTDPAVMLGGGLRFNVSDRLMIRPDARALIVIADARTHALGVFTLHVAYRF